MRSFRLLAGALVLAAAAAGQQMPAPDRPGSIKASALVERVLVDAYVTGPDGAALSGLGVSDFRLRVDDLEVPVEDVEWVPADQPEERPSNEPGTPAFPPGRLLVVFVQSDIGRVRTPWLMKLTNEAVLALDRLLPTDRVAVVSYDSHLKLRLDFSSDRERIQAAIFDGLKHERIAPLPPGPFPSLARHFDFQAARDAATVERGLLATAKALEPIPGAKAMLFLGWGLRVDRRVKDHLYHAMALEALAKARVTVFTLDVTDADWHTLEVELIALADATGGTYEKSHEFGALAFDRVLRAVEGRYVITFVRPERERGRHDVALELRARKGRVLFRPYYDDGEAPPEPSAAAVPGARPPVAMPGGWR